MTVRIVTDSISDLPQKYIDEYQIGVVPINVRFGDEVLKDGVDIWSEEFYHRLKNELQEPSTSTSGPGEYLQVYEKIAEPGDTVISIHGSEALSSSVNSARLAAKMVEGRMKVEVINSQSVSMGAGFMALKAARMVKEGFGPELILESISKWQQESLLFFTVNSLEYLHRNGRIGKAAVLLGGLLNIKPLLSLEEGVIVPMEKIRGSAEKVAARMVEYIYQRFGDKPLMVYIGHGELPDAAHQLHKIAKERLVIAEFVPGIVGPTVGSHAGPEIFGIVATPK